MKKTTFAATIVLASLCVIGCDSREQVRKEAQSFSKTTTESASLESKFTTGEKDPFNSRNGIESIRKKRLTKFGRLKQKPPVETLTQSAADKALNKDGYGLVAVGTVSQGTIQMPAYPFDYENDTRALAALKKSHDISSIISDDMTSLDIAKVLTSYTYEFLKDGTIPGDDWVSSTYPSAKSITEMRRKQGIGGRSEHYAALLCQLSLSCGFVSRVVGMHTVSDDGSLLEHTICEIYLNSINKWVAFDPYSKATLYTRDGMPLSAAELRTLMLDNLYNDIDPVVGSGDFTEIIAVREKLLPRYKYLYIWRMNDFLGKSSGNKSIGWPEVFATHLVWEDVRSLVVDGAFDSSDRFEKVRFVTHDPYDFDWKVNQVQLHFDRIGEQRMNVYIDSFTPNFVSFNASIFSNGGGKPLKFKSSVLKLSEVMVHLNVNAQNAFNVGSNTASVEIDNP